MTDVEHEAIKAMIRDQLVARGIADKRVLSAFERVNRYDFVPSEFRALACSDQPLPLIGGQTISQPYIVAIMTELLEITNKSKILEIGSGSGYQTAILAELAGTVYSMEILRDLHNLARANLSESGYRNVHLILGNGYEGYPDAAPYDAIILSAAPPSIPGKLVAQLAVGGRMALPVGSSAQMLCLLTLLGDKRIRQRTLFPVVFVPMVDRPEKG